MSVWRFAVPKGAKSVHPQPIDVRPKDELLACLPRADFDRMRPHVRTQSASPPIRIVCLGGSAGALAAYRAILGAVPPDSGMAFIVVAHRRLGFDYVLGPLLEAVTTMHVSTIAQGQRIEPNTVVLLPARHNVAIVDGRLRLSAQGKTVGLPMTITKFLQTLAIDAGARAVAVILSGLADDGSAALSAIKAAGGITFAQANARWTDMPRHAIETGHVDFVLSSEEIGRALASLSEAPLH
jgi:two-component system CheB/CheR fusion protein